MQSGKRWEVSLLNWLEGGGFGLNGPFFLLSLSFSSPRGRPCALSRRPRLPPTSAAPSPVSQRGGRKRTGNLAQSPLPSSLFTKETPTLVTKALPVFLNYKQALQLINFIINKPLHLPSRPKYFQKITNRPLPSQDLLQLGP